MPFAMSVDAADKPASPEPTMIANFDSLAISMSVTGDGVDTRVKCRQKMDASAMKIEIDPTMKNFFRVIEAQKEDDQEYL